MRGHVRKRGRGWVFVVDDGRDPVTEKRQQKWSHQYPTKREAEHELCRSLGRLDAGDDPIPEKITIAALAEGWFAHMAAMDKPRPKVQRGYGSSIRRDVLPMIGHLEVRKTKPAHCQAVLDRFGESHSPSTTARLRAVMSRMFGQALAWDLIPTNPVTATSTPARPKRKLTVPEPAQVRDIIEAARGAAYEIPILIAAVSGARRSEVLGLAWSSTDVDAGTIRIERTLQRVGDRLVFNDDTKTANSARTVPLPAFAVERLRAHKAAQARRRLALGGDWTDLDLVCDRADGRAVDPDLFSQAFKRVAKSVGLEGARLHDLRHAAATRLMRSGLHPVEVAEIMGHASPSFTANVYQHADHESLERTRAAIEGAFGQ